MNTPRAKARGFKPLKSTLPFASPALAGFASQPFTAPG